LAGKSNLLYKAHEMNVNISNREETLKQTLRRVKQLEHQGYEFEAAEASLRVLLESTVRGQPEYFVLENIRVIDEIRRDGQVLSEATVKVRLGERILHTVAEGDGPVHALDRALHGALQQFYQSLESVQLTDYKVRVINAKEGTAARVRVLIQQSDGEENWSTVGVSENILEASYLALADGVRYKLMKDHVPVLSRNGNPAPGLD
jgi:2-isopropylmalate synthase